MFTAEVAEEFENSRLLTLDFKIWLEGDQINHHYYQKKMKTPFVGMKRSAMAQQQKMSVLSNEVIGRQTRDRRRKRPRW